MKAQHPNEEHDDAFLEATKRRHPLHQSRFDCQIAFLPIGQDGCESRTLDSKLGAIIPLTTERYATEH